MGSNVELRAAGFKVHCTHYKGDSMTKNHSFGRHVGSVNRGTWNNT